MPLHAAAPPLAPPLHALPPAPPYLVHPQAPEQRVAQHGKATPLLRLILHIRVGMEDLQARCGGRRSHVVLTRHACTPLRARRHEQRRAGRPLCGPALLAALQRPPQGGPPGPVAARPAGSAAAAHLHCGPLPRCPLDGSREGRGEEGEHQQRRHAPLVQPPSARLPIALPEHMLCLAPAAHPRARSRGGPAGRCCAGARPFCAAR